MGVSSPPTSATAALSKSDAAVTIACLAALPSFAGEASLELAADDVIEFILVSIAEANLKRVNILNLKLTRTYSVTYLANAFPDATDGPSEDSAVDGPSSTSVAAAPIRAAFPPLSASGRSLSIHEWTSRKAEFLLLPMRVRAARLRPVVDVGGGSSVIVGSHDCRQ